MMRYRPHGPPPGFENAMKPFREKAQDQVDKRKRPRFEKKDQKWRGFKNQLQDGTKRKCAYCEVKITADRYKGDVEHCRPKGRIDRLEVEESGARRQKTQWETGYWWLAYAWDNYLLSCNTCNSKYKHSFFPLRDPAPQRAPVQGDEEHESPLLLHPFHGPDPAGHLQFDEIGQITSLGESRHGAVTIQICGLDREELRDSREEKAEKTSTLLRRLDAALQAGEPVLEFLEDIYDSGCDRYVHAGMVRCMFTQKTQWDWLLIFLATKVLYIGSPIVPTPGS